MKKRLLLVAGLFFSLHCSLRAGDGDFAVSKIPAELLKSSNAVIRLHEQHIVLKHMEKMIIKERIVITVLNEKGDEYAYRGEGYDKFNSIESIEGTLYDHLGKKLKSLKKSEIKDVSVTNESLAIDGRLKVHSFYYKVYPYTVEYMVETVKKETMFFPQWVPVPGAFVAVEQSSMSIKVPSGYKLRYRTFNYNKEPVITDEGAKTQIYTWEIKQYKPVVPEGYAPGWKAITPFVMTAPSDFMIEDYQGKMNSWSELGLFQASLNEGRDVLPVAIQEKVRELVKDVSTKKEKVSRLYQFLQANTRYISIQLGVGGWRPFDATYVATKGYGDCKALSNYMHSLLKQAGILSYYTLIRAGNGVEDIVADFPARQFNHVILCVPDGRDTIWLECTSQTTAAGYMGKFTGNRHALLITEEGGKLVKTPEYGMEENLQIRNVKAKLDEQGTLSTATNSSYSGLQQDDIHGLINALSKEKVKEYLHEQLNFPTYDINKFDYREQKSAVPVISESLDITVSNYATITGKRLFILPNIMTRAGSKMAADSTRKYDIQFNYEYRDVDTVEIELPAGYTPEQVPKDVVIKSQFGAYQSSIKLDGNKLYYYRSYEHKSGRFPAKHYADLVEFSNAVYKADRNRVVLVKEETEKKAF